MSQLLKKLLMVFLICLFLNNLQLKGAEGDYTIEPFANIKTFPSYIIHLTIQSQPKECGKERCCFKQQTPEKKEIVAQLYRREPIDKNVNHYKKLDSSAVLPSELPVGSVVGVIVDPSDSIFTCELSSTPLVEEFFIDLGPKIGQKIMLNNVDFSNDKIPSEKMKVVSFEMAGAVHLLVVKVFASALDCLNNKDGIIVYKAAVKTDVVRPKWGIQAGVMMPFEEPKFYRLKYKNVALTYDADGNPTNLNDTLPTIEEYRTPVQSSMKAIVFITFRPCKKCDFHFNLGTELSKSALDVFLAGLGYQFKYVSVNFFVRLQYRDTIDESEYKDGYILVNPNLKTIPLIKGNDVSCGVVMSVPLNIFTGLFGQIFK